MFFCLSLLTFKDVSHKDVSHFFRNQFVLDRNAFVIKLMYQFAKEQNELKKTEQSEVFWQTHEK
jgi:hypothetical protein